MEPDELTDDLEVEEQDETVEEEVTPEEEQTQDTNTPTVEERLARAEARAAKFQRLFEKGNKKPAAQTQETTTPPPSNVDVEEVVLRAQGMSDELLAQLKDVATLRKTSLLDAQKDSLFVAAKAQFEKEEKSKAASLGSSRASGTQRVQKTLTTPNLSREEHMKLVKA